jgi:hypothetical protein
VAQERQIMIDRRVTDGLAFWMGNVGPAFTVELVRFDREWADLRQPLVLE